MVQPKEHWYPEPPGKRSRLVLFVHGFTGEAVKTWGNFPALLQADSQLKDYDFCFWGYPTSLNPLYGVLKFFWSDNPNLDTAGHGFRTLLDNACQSYKKIVLVAHSMGGLIVQRFILQEIAKGRKLHLDRLAEVIFYGTPSGGLIKAYLAALLLGSEQAADMGRFSSFIEDLRYQWRRQIDDRRATHPPLFRLTLVAGMKDKFVPQRSSLDPFFFDEKEIVPGTHTKMTKPDSAQDLRYLVLRNRLLRNAPNKAEREIIQGASRESVEGINRVRGAAHLCDVEDLMAQAVDLLKEPAALPLVERALGLALLDNEVYSQAAELLKRYVDFEMPGGGGHPFSTDAQALQQLAIALSGAGNIRDAVTRLEALDPQLRSDPETLGILGGRFKRQWLKTETKPQIGYRALDLYRKALALARADELPNQIYYNGINVAYLLFALGEDGYQPLTEEVLAICELLSEPDYWSDATRGECFLLLRRYPEAREAYNAAARRQHESRHWTSTGQQALDILKRQGDPQEAAAVAALFQRIRPDFRPSGSVGG